jgi:hypothetical protein
MGFLAMVQTPGGGHGTSMRPPVAQNVSLRSLVGNQVIGYPLVTWSLLANVTGNLGIATRQKWMFAPALLVFFISTFVARNTAITSNQLTPIRRPN